MILKLDVFELEGFESGKDMVGSGALAGGTINIIYFILLYTDSHGAALKCKRDSGGF